MNPFDDLVLPPGFRRETAERHPSWTPPEARALLIRLMGAAGALRERPATELIQILGRAGRRFVNRRDPLRREAERRVAQEAGYSPAMARAVVEGMARDWIPERLERALRTDFPDPRVLEGFREGEGGSRVRAVGSDLTLQVVSGSVPGVGATALLRSLLVRSPTLLKPGRGDVALPVLLARAIGEEDEGVASALGVVYWSGGEGGALEEEALRHAGRVVVYGSDETVEAVRRRLSRTTPLVVYHHRISVGVVGRGALADEGEARRAALDAARAASLFEQRGCVSPHVIWVEEGGTVTPSRWCELLAEGMDALAGELPPEPPSSEEASEIQQFRALTEMRVAGGDGGRLFAGEGLSWTLAFETDPVFAPSCLGRTVRVKPVAELDQVPGLLAPVAPWLQTVALEGAGEREAPLTEMLARTGATRISTFWEQPFPPAWWRHDGRGPLEVLVRWVVQEGGE